MEAEEPRRQAIGNQLPNIVSRSWKRFDCDISIMNVYSLNCLSGKNRRKWNENTGAVMQQRKEKHWKKMDGSLLSAHCDHMSKQ